MIFEAIRNRRSISTFLQEDVSSEIIDELISIAGYAPSSCNTQPWFFLVFHTKVSRGRLNDYIEKGYERTRRGLLEKHSIMGSAYVKLLDFFTKYGRFDEAPVLMLLFARPYDTPVFSQAIRLAGNEAIQRIAEDSVKTSAAMAMQNFLLAAHGKGLGTRVKDGIKFLVNFEDLRCEFYNEFQIHESFQLISGIQLGYPAESSLKRVAPKRLPLENIRRII